MARTEASVRAALEGVPDSVQSEGVLDSVTSEGVPDAVPDGDDDDEEEEEEETNWAVTALPEFWALVAEHSGLVGAWRLMRVCKVARVGAKEWLRTLPGLVVCGGYIEGSGRTREVWRLDLGELRWERMSDLGCGRSEHACCIVRGRVVVLGGRSSEGDVLATVEALRYDSEAEEHTFADLPPMSCGPCSYSIALPIDESESAEGQVLLLGGYCKDAASSGEAFSRVINVDLATGAYTPHPPLLYERWRFAAARLPDGRVVCAGSETYYDDDEDEDDDYYGESITAEVLQSPEQGSPDDAAWRWRELPHMRVHREGAAGCVLSDGRFAVFGGEDGESVKTASCEVLTLDGNPRRWEPLPPMRATRYGLTCAAVGGCVIVAGGTSSGSTAAVEVYEEARRRWRRLPCNLPHDRPLMWPGSALM
jgi:hypothetical protein